MPRPREGKKIKLSVTVRPYTRTLLEQRAARTGRSLSQTLEDLVHQVDGEDDYFRKQAAFQGFMAAALVAALASRTLGPEATRHLQERIAQTSRRLYGRSPVRTFEADEPLFDDHDDPRIWALFAAFGAEGPD